MLKKHNINGAANKGMFGFVGFVAYVSAVVYFLQGADHAGDVIYAFIEAAVWPGIVLFYVLTSFGA